MRIKCVAFSWDTDIRLSGGFPISCDLERDLAAALEETDPEDKRERDLAAETIRAAHRINGGRYAPCDRCHKEDWVPGRGTGLNRYGWTYQTCHYCRGRGIVPKEE